MLFIIFYTFLFFILHFYLGRGESFRRSKLVAQYILCFALLFGFFGFRDLPILNDTAHYYEHFMEVIYDDYFERLPFYYLERFDRFEPGYQIYERIVGRIWYDPYAIILITSLIISIAFVWLAGQYTDKIALWLFIMMLSGIGTMYSAQRQAIAAIIFFVSFRYLYPKHVLWYYCSIPLAMTFHNSAIILFLIPTICKLELNKRNISLLVVATVLTAFGILNIILFLDYGESFYYKQALQRETTPLAAMLNCALSLLLLLVIYRLHRKNPIIDDEERPLWWLSLLCVCILFISVPFLILSRYALFFQPFMHILFIRKIYQCKNILNRRGILFAIIAILFLRFIVVLVYKPEWSHFYPYAFYDFNELYHETRLGY